MVENPRPDEVQATNDSPLPSAKTAGQLLKAARLEAGVHLVVLSVALKISVRKLEALEADQYLIDQSPVFVRGLASSVCRQLRIGPAPVLSLLPDSRSDWALQARVLQAHVRADFGLMSDDAPKTAARAWWLAVGMLLMIAALIWLPSPAQWGGMSQVWAHLAAWSSERVLASEPEAQAAGVSDAATLGAVSVVPAVLSPAQTVSSPAEAAVAETALASAAASPAANAPVPQLQFTATQSSWIEVRDAKSQLVWSGVLKSGESHRVPIAQALNVVIGRSDAIQVMFKGQAFDLKPYTQASVARFEVKP